MSKSIKVDYTLAPPASVQPDVDGGPAPTSEELAFTLVEGGNAPPVKRYYDAASRAVREAQDALNEKFTVWKEAVGDLEKEKEVLVHGEGMGKAARMMAANKAAEAALDEEEEDEDGVDLAEAGTR